MALLMAGQFISVLGDAFFNIGLLLLVYELTGSGATTGWVSACSYIPILLFGFFAGAFVDQFQYKPMMIFADLGRVVLCAIIPLADWLGVLSPVLIGVVAFFMAMFAALFIPARDSMVPILATEVSLTRANSLIQGSTQAGLLVGPFLGATLIEYTSPVFLFVADCGTFLLSAVLLAFIRLSSEQQHQQEESQEARSFRRVFRDMAETVRYIVGKRALRWVLGVSFLNNIFIMGPATIGMMLYVKNVLQQENWVYAAGEGMIAAGMLTTSLLFAYLGKPMANGRLWYTGLVLDGLTWIPVAFAATWQQMLAFVYIHALMIPLLMVPRATIIQEQVPKQLRGRVFSLVFVSVYGCMGLSVALTGLLSEYIPVEHIFIGIGVCGALTGLAGATVREIRELE